MKQNVKTQRARLCELRKEQQKTATWNSRFFMINDISEQFEHDIVEKMAY